MSRVAAASGIAPLLAFYATDLVEVDGLLVASHRGCPPVATIDDGDLGARAWSGSLEAVPKVTVSITPELELPAQVEVTYFDPDRQYETNTQIAIRHTKPHVSEVAQLTVPIVLSAKGARRTAERQLYQTWLERTGCQFALGPEWLSLVPGSPIMLPVEDLGPQRVRVSALDMAMPGEVRFSAVLDGDWVLDQNAVGWTTGPSLNYSEPANSMYLAMVGV